MNDLHLPALDGSPAVLLISGGRRIGKTTLLLKLRAAALQAGLSVGGFLSVARFDSDGEKTGIDVIDAGSERTAPLATVGEGGAVRTGHYSFDPAGLAAGLRFAEAGRTADLFFVDELGPLELVRGEGWARVLPMIRARTHGITLVVVRPELIDAVREQLSAESPVITVDEENRDRLAVELCRWTTERN